MMFNTMSNFGTEHTQASGAAFHLQEQRLAPLKLGDESGGS